jgi:hypothetical protein
MTIGESRKKNMCDESGGIDTFVLVYRPETECSDSTPDFLPHKLPEILRSH